jgi:hypothetical protein
MQLRISLCIGMFVIVYSGGGCYHDPIMIILICFKVKRLNA